MIVEYIRYQVEDLARRNELVAAYQQAALSLDRSPVCLSYELSVCEENETDAILRIEWTSTEDHLQIFRKSIEFRAFFAAIGPFLKQIVEMRHYTRTAVQRDKWPR